jgi:alpha-D-ribose 1-methylphosphonate 5-triphosphate diphosphatase
LHVRHEVCLVEGHEELLRWMDEGRVHMLSTTDHLPESDDAAKRDRYRLAAARRLTCDPAALDRMIALAVHSRAKGLAQLAELAAAARCLGIPLASHDDDAASIAASLDRGVAICEFPRDLATAGRARQGGAQVLMGAPNWVRGGSHLGLLGVAEALADGIVDLLCSDYHYPSLLPAPFLMAQQGLRSLPQAWAMVSAVPAAAAGLLDKGRIAAGYAADLLLVDARDPGRCRLKSVFVAGREVARFA